MTWLEETLGMELSTGAQWALLFLILAVALAILFWVFRMIFGYGGAKLSRNRQPRLSVTDAAMVDDKRRLVLVRRDKVEHLVMIGGPSDIVIEQGIERAQTGQCTRPAQSAKTQTPTPHSPQPFTDPTSSKASTEANETGRLVNEPAPATGTTGLAAAIAAPVASAASETPSTPKTSNPTDTSAESFSSEAAQRLSQSVSGTEQPKTQGTAAQAPDTPQSDPGTLDDVKPDRPEASTATETPSQSASSNSAETRKEPDTDDLDGSTESDTGNSRTEDEMQRLLDELTAKKG